MNVLAPVKTIMTSELITVNPKDKLSKVKEIFDNNRIHHIPVVRFKEMVGMISKTDLLHFLRGFNTQNEEDRFVNEARMRAFVAEDLMTKGLAKVSSSDRINVVLEILRANQFHAVPVVDNNELVGIVTTFDIINELANQEVTPEQILNAQKAEK